MQSFKQKDKEYVAATYARFDVEIVNGKGSLLYDVNGKEYIDLSSGIAVNTFGVSDETWKEAVIGQINKVQHTSNLYYSKPCADLAELLCERTGAKKVFFSNSGAEANECAIKTARLWGELNKGKDYFNIITFKNGFHGRTITTLSATAQEVFHEHFYPMTAGFIYAEAGDAWVIDKLLKENKCCAVMLELIQGEGGVLPMDKDFISSLFKVCKENDVLFVIDEVQTGNGRTGTMYCYEQYGVSPDIITTAKGLAGGLPFGATLLFEKTKDVLKAGLHGSTFGGNPVCAAAAISTVNRIDDALLKEVKEKSDYIVKELSEAKGVKSVSGMGLMLGIETECDASSVIKSCIEMGALPIKAKNKVRLLPALNIPMELVKKAVEILKRAVEENL